MTKLMVVDDEKDMRDILELMLSDSGFEILKAESGVDCIKKIVDNPVDVILMDIRMPELNGWETIKKLKEMGVTDKTRIIILTVEKGPGVEIFGLQDVIADYVTKPFDREKLLDCINKALG